jgi:class 3 adenylate cyclase
VRIGVHAGSAIIDDDDYRGRDVVIAALAGADEIFVSGAVTASLAAGVVVSSVGTRDLKGIPEPVEIARVDWR